MPVPESDLPVLLPDTVDYHGSRREPADPRRGVPERHLPDVRRARRSARPTRWTRSSTRPGTGSATCRRTRPTAPVDPDMVETWTPGRPVHGRRRARGDAPAVQPVLHQGDARRRPRPATASRSCGCSTRARSWAPTASGCRKSRGNVQDPDELVAPLRRRHRPAVPDVHGPVGPGRAVEPDRDRRRVQVPAPRLDDRDRPARHASRATRRRATLPAGEDEHAARDRMRAAAHRTLRDVTEDFEGFRWNTMVAKLMELANVAVPLPRHVGRRAARVGRGRQAAAADAGAGRAAHQRGAVVAPPGRARRAVGVDPRPARGRRSTSARSSSRPARSRSRSTASCATGSRCPPGSREIELEQVVMSRDKVVAAIGAAAGRAGHPRRRRPARQHRRPADA